MKRNHRNFKDIELSVTEDDHCREREKENEGIEYTEDDYNKIP